MTLVHCSGDEARDARERTLGGEPQILTAAGWVDKPSWREARADDPRAARDADRDASSGVRVGGWEQTHAAARRWADLNAATGGDECRGHPARACPGGKAARADARAALYMYPELLALLESEV